MSITLGDAIFYFKGDNSDLDRATDEATQKTEGAAGKIKGFLSNAFAVTLGGFIQQGLQSITGGFGNLWHGMIDGNAEFERYNVQFGVLLGGADKAKARLDELAKFGAATPFDLPEIVKADKVLQSFGLHSEEAAKKFGFSGTDIRTIAGDVAAGTGSSFEDMSLLIGKFSAGATGEVLSRFAQMGVATKEELAQMGVKFNKAGQMMTPVPEATEKVLQLMKKKYGGMMDAQSKTFEGMMSNLNDWVGGTLRTIGQPIFEKLKDSLGGVLNWLGSDEVKGAIAGFAETLASGIKGIVDWATGLGQSVMDGIGLAMPYITTAWEVIQDLIGFVSDGGQDYDWFDGLGTKLSDLFGGSADDWRTWVETIGDNMTAAKDWIVGAWQTVKDWAETNLPALLALDIQIWGAIGTFIKDVVAPDVFTLISDGFGAAKGWMDENFPIMQSIVQKLLDSFSTGAVTSDPKATWQQIWEGVRAMLGTQWELLGGTFRGVLQIMNGDTTTGLTTIGDSWNSMWAKIFAALTPVWNNIKDGVKNTLKKVNDDTVDMFNGLADWLGKLPAKMYPIGKEIVLAIGRAIIDQAGTIYNNLWAILSSAVNGIGAKLGITIPGFGGSAPGAPGGSSGGTGGKGVGVGDQGNSFANSVASTGAGLGGLSIAGAGVAGTSVGVTINVAQMSSDFDLEQVGLYVANKIRGAITR